MFSIRCAQVLLPATLLAASISPNAIHAQASSNVTVVATGLEGPRGLKFGPDGMLYVAEAGIGGTTSTAGQCTQVIPPIGPYTGGMTGRISRIDSSGKRTTVASGFPSSVNAVGDHQGVADLLFAEGNLYALIAGGGCSHGVANGPNQIASVNIRNGSWKTVANLSQFLLTHPVRYPNADDFEPDGTFYSMIFLQDHFYAVEPNHGQVLSVSLDGKVKSVIDVSATQGHIVPTAITHRDGQFYLGNLNLFPIEMFGSKIMTLSRAECSRVAAPGLDEFDEVNSLHIVSSKAGFETIVGLDFGPDGLLYVLELSAAPGNPTPGAGKVVRVKHDGDIEDVATGLAVPTAMTFGPDGKLYVSNLGAAPPGAGQVVRIDVP
jgi:glucose/arabinose dehydrogenase